MQVVNDPGPGFCTVDPLGLGRIDADRALLIQFGATAEEIGEQLENLWRSAKNHGDGDYCPAPGIVLRIEQATGRSACPFGHPGRYDAGGMSVTTPDVRFTISRLSIHLIREHGFFGERGTTARLEPHQIIRLLRDLSSA